MIGRTIYLVVGTLLIFLTVGDAIFTDNDAQEQQANLVGVLGGIGLTIAATAFHRGRQQQSPQAPPPQYPQMTGQQAPPAVPGYPGQPNHPGQVRY